MNSDFPNYLVEELAARRCAIVVGSGVSRTCTDLDGASPPSWEDLLKSLSVLVRDTEAMRCATDAIARKMYLDAAQIITCHSDPVDRERELRRLLDRKWTPSKWVECLRGFDQDVYITTNYDCIIEDSFGKEGFSVHTHKEKAAARTLRSPQHLIYKFHGCVRGDSDDIVLAGSDYYRLRAESPFSLKLLEAILVTRTAVFVGYSLADPDMQLVLHNVRLSVPGLRKHFWLVEESANYAVIAAIEDALNVEAITYPHGQHDVGLNLLLELLDSVEAFRASRSA
jgi:SIR2-like domain